MSTAGGSAAPSTIAQVIEHVVDTARYPLTDAATPAYARVVAHVRDELATVGCCVLAEFVRRELQGTLQQECVDVAPRAYYDVETVNVYNTTPDPALPADHPARTTMQRSNAFVARDDIPIGAVVHRLYTCARFRRFVADCFGLDNVHPLADPLSGLTVNVITPGREHPWHFDTNEFTVSMLTQPADGGGMFEYCPHIRSGRRENFADVRDVLAGGGKHLVRSLTLRPGDLQLFTGRHSLHRVTAVRGDTARHSAIFAYSERPGVISTVARTRQLFGRVTPAHLDAEHSALRVDELLI